MMNYRINYGNGQVQEFASRRAALAELGALTQYRAFAFVERYIGDGEWSKVVA